MKNLMDNWNNASEDELRAGLIAEGVDRALAEQLVAEVPEVCRRQLGYLDFQDDADDRTATLVASIDSDWPEPSRSYWANIARRHREQEETSTDTGESSSGEGGASNEGAEELNTADPHMLEEAAVRDIPSDEAEWQDAYSSPTYSGVEQGSEEPLRLPPQNYALADHLAPALQGALASATNGAASEAEVQELVEALEQIAAMPHLDGDKRGVPCPACTAWDALRRWSHRRSVEQSLPAV